MNSAEVLGLSSSVISVLVGILVALLAWTYTSNKGAVEKDIGKLTEQNRSQALDLERLKQRADDALAHDNRLYAVLEKLDDKVDHIAQEVAAIRRAGNSPPPFPPRSLR